MAILKGRVLLIFYSCLGAWILNLKCHDAKRDIAGTPVEKCELRGFRSGTNIVYKRELFDVVRKELEDFPGFKILFVYEPCFRKYHKFKAKLDVKSTCFGPFNPEYLGTKAHIA